MSSVTGMWRHRRGCSVNSDDAVCGALLAGGTLAMAAIDGAVVLTIGAAGLGYVCYKSFAANASRPADVTYADVEEHLQRRAALVAASDEDEQTKRAKIKRIREELAIVKRHRQQNSAKLRGSVAQIAGLGVFAWPILAPLYLGSWFGRTFGSREHYTKDEVVERAKARWEALDNEEEKQETE